MGEALRGHHGDRRIGLAPGTDGNRIDIVGDAINRDPLYAADPVGGDDRHMSCCGHHLATGDAKVMRNFAMHVVAADDGPTATRQHLVMIDQDLDRAGSEDPRKRCPWKDEREIG